MGRGSEGFRTIKILILIKNWMKGDVCLSRSNNTIGWFFVDGMVWEGDKQKRKHKQNVGS